MSIHTITLTHRQLCDFELLLNGSFYPLKGYLNQKDYISVIKDLRLSDKSIWAMPITLSVPSIMQDQINQDDQIILEYPKGEKVGYVIVEDIYKPDLIFECENVYGTTDTNHPMVKEILANQDICYVGGEVFALTLPTHYDFIDDRYTPAETKKYFKDNGWDIIVGFQTRNPMHYCHYELTKFALHRAGEKAKLFLNPVIGKTQPGDIDYPTRVRCYKHMINAGLWDDNVLLSLLPLAMRMGGPREALWHALIRRNYGCTHFVVGRDHAGPSTITKEGKKFYDPYAAHRLLDQLKNEIGIEIIKSPMIVYVPSRRGYDQITNVPKGIETAHISGTELRRRLRNNEYIPDWFTMPKVAQELKQSLDHKTGICFYFVGLSGAGKSTLAKALQTKLLEKYTAKDIHLLDGDEVRTHITSMLGFNKRDRSLNVKAIGYVASLIVKMGGIALCANIAPYEEDRLYNKEMIEKHGHYFEIYVDTSLEVCEERDVKGLYKRARAGEIKQFTGIDDPFEEPRNPDLRVTGNGKLCVSLNKIMNLIKDL